MGPAAGLDVDPLDGPNVGPDVGPGVGPDVGTVVGPDVGPPVGIDFGSEMGPEVGLLIGPDHFITQDDRNHKIPGFILVPPFTVAFPCRGVSTIERRPLYHYWLIPLGKSPSDSAGVERSRQGRKET